MIRVLKMCFYEVFVINCVTKSLKPKFNESNKKLAFLYRGIY